MRFELSIEAFLRTVNGDYMFGGPFQGMVKLRDVVILEGTDIKKVVKGVTIHHPPHQIKAEKMSVLLDIGELDPSVFVGKKLVGIDGE